MRAFRVGATTEIDGIPELGSGKFGGVIVGLHDATAAGAQSSESLVVAIEEDREL